MTWIWVLMAILLLGVTAAVAVGYGGSMGRAYPDRPELLLPADRMVAAEDLEDVRFSVVLRGYRMDEVDDVVRRLVRELAERDARIAELSAAGDAGDGLQPPRPAPQQAVLDPRTEAAQRDGRPGRHRVRELGGQEPTRP